jgi:hypothetical protein
MRFLDKVKHEFLDFIYWKPEEGPWRKVTTWNLAFLVATFLILFIVLLLMIRFSLVKP